MAEVRVAVPGASGWMGKVHTMAYQTFPHFPGTSGGTARVVALVDTAAQARELADIAAAKGLTTRVGHAFPRNPGHDPARKIIVAGEIGEIKLFKAGQHVDPLAPYMWRADGNLAPTGIVGDTGTNVFSFMDFLVGWVSALIADNHIVTSHRPVVSGPGYGEQAVLTGNEVWSDVTNPDGANVKSTWGRKTRSFAPSCRCQTLRLAIMSPRSSRRQR